MAETFSSLEELITRFGLTEIEGQRLQLFDQVFLETQAHTNLVAPASIEERWTRHYADSLQLLETVPPAATSWFDIGSGAGFPAIILAAVLQERFPNLRFTACDSVKKKARFLEAAVDAMQLTNVTVSDQRAEVFHVKRTRFDVVSARAVAGLDKLLDLTVPLLAKGGLLIFPKGEKADEELTQAAQRWTFKTESRPSMTHDSAKILLLRHPEHRQ